MKSKYMKQIFCAATFLLFAPFSSVHAHSIFGQQTASSGGVDWFTVNCPLPTSYLEASIADQVADNDFVTMTIFATSAISYSNQNGGGAPGPFQQLTDGAQVYNIMVTHSGILANQSYFILYHCRAAGGGEVNPVGGTHTVKQDDN